ncbi:MAG: DUF86 domain-containing protein [Candidatus Thorarchaeota archaeon]
MDLERRTRYLTKIEYVIDSLQLADQLTDNPDTVQTKALYYCLLTSIESTMDLIAMLLKDKGTIAKGDKSNIEYLNSENYVSSELAAHLNKCKGLRNVLVHQYNGIDRAIVLRSFDDIKNTLTGFVDILEKVLDEF